jgi:hypothetical protein
MAYEQMGNVDLKWERTKKFNIGFDATLFKRFNIEFDYYLHKTTDMVFAVPASYAMGLTSYYANIGELQNSGIEFTLGAIILKDKDWNWNVSLTGSHNTNEVKKLATDTPIEGTYQITEVGRPIYQYKMKEYAGVDPATGNPLWYLNETGDETTDNYNKAAKRYLGDANPDFLGSFSNNLNWKNIDFSFQLNYSFGRKIYGNNLRYDEQIGGSYGENFAEYVYENRWQNPGDITDVPRIQLDDYRNWPEVTSDRYLIDASYFAIKNITLSYNLPRTFLNKIGIQGAKVFASGDNLCLFTHLKGMDPQYNFTGGTNYDYSPNRTYTIGLEVNF